MMIPSMCRRDITPYSIAPTDEDVTSVVDTAPTITWLCEGSYYLIIKMGNVVFFYEIVKLWSVLIYDLTSLHDCYSCIV